MSRYFLVTLQKRFYNSVLTKEIILEERLYYLKGAFL
ncbi:hypothetical protein HNR36_001311 [Ureibacillus thermosphaericus]|jgi:hypothetical protein|uniref:Uncharacterized protein n=1 Tax=Ureibacillus thermosphaericus TaxID=51173 RepID=A0A840PKH2_URETH|nr:hypothetical protein [Ureibacillus thermosphaericus]